MPKGLVVLLQENSLLKMFFFFSTYFATFFCANVFRFEEEQVFIQEISGNFNKLKNLIENQLDHEKMFEKLIASQNFYDTLAEMEFHRSESMSQSSFFQLSSQFSMFELSFSLISLIFDVQNRLSNFV